MLSRNSLYALSLSFSVPLATAASIVMTKNLKLRCLGLFSLSTSLSGLLQYFLFNLENGLELLNARLTLLS
jgi:hypothetical protein